MANERGYVHPSNVISTVRTEFDILVSYILIYGDAIHIFRSFERFKSLHSEDGMRMIVNTETFR